MPKKIWQILEGNKALREKLAAECGISPITAQILINRGITELSQANDFLKSDIKSLHDPFLMKDMDKAVTRIKKAITGNGHASKHQVQRMVQNLLNLKTPPEPVDVIDALAMAISYCYIEKRKR